MALTRFQLDVLEAAKAESGMPGVTITTRLVAERVGSIPNAVGKTLYMLSRRTDPRIVVAVYKGSERVGWKLTEQAWEAE